MLNRRGNRFPDAIFECCLVYPWPTIQRFFDRLIIRNQLRGTDQAADMSSQNPAPIPHTMAPDLSSCSFCLPTVVSGGRGSKVPIPFCPLCGHVELWERNGGAVGGRPSRFKRETRRIVPPTDCLAAHSHNDSLWNGHFRRPWSPSASPPKRTCTGGGSTSVLGQ
jgi:hypothetical protein